MERYKELYAYSKDVLNAEKDRYYNIERKASQYLTVLTLLIGLSGLSINSTIMSLIPPHTPAEKFLSLLLVLVWLSLFTSWYVIFSVLRMTGLSIPPLDETTMTFFSVQKEVDIYYYLGTTNEGLPGI